MNGRRSCVIQHAKPLWRGCDIDTQVSDRLAPGVDELVNGKRLQVTDLQRDRNLRVAF